MKLYLVQHGEACAEDVDPERPLTARGRADVAALADFLGRAGVRVGRVVHSGKLRARQTAECLAASVAPGGAAEAGTGLAPNDDPACFDWQGESGGQDLLVVGHLPFMARAVSLLVLGEADRPVVAYTPGSLVCLETAGPGWQIAWMVRPALLRGDRQ